MTAGIWVPPDASGVDDFDASEYARRRTRVRAAMQARGCDVAVVDGLEDINYLTGVSVAGTSYQAYILPMERTPIVVLRSIDRDLFLENRQIGECAAYGDHEEPVAVVIDVLRRRGHAAGRIGLDFASNALTVERYRAYEAACPGRIVAFTNGITEVRWIKSASEIACMRRAAAIADETMRRVVATMAVGVSERVAATVAASSYMKLGASCAHVGPIAAVRRGGGLHATLGDRVLELGDVLHVELLPEYRGYSARLIRSVVIGEPTAEQLWITGILVGAQDAQIAAMVPEAVASDVDAICRERVLAAGVRKSYDNVTGYTLGLYGTPRMSRISDFSRAFTPTARWKLEAGMTFHMYVSAAGLAVSESVLVADEGPVRLTSTARALLVASG